MDLRRNRLASAAAALFAFSLIIRSPGVASMIAWVLIGVGCLFLAYAIAPDAMALKRRLIPGHARKHLKQLYQQGVELRKEASQLSWSSDSDNREWRDKCRAWERSVLSYISGSLVLATRFSQRINWDERPDEIFFEDRFLDSSKNYGVWKMNNRLDSLNEIILHY